MDPSKSDHNGRTQITSTLQTDTLAASVTILLLMTVIQRAVGFTRSILICRWLPQEEVGQWDMAFGFLMLAAPLSVLAVPVCLGRYLEYYRQRGQLKMLITRTGIVAVILGSISTLILLTFREWFSELIFGVPDKDHIVGLLAIALIISIATHYFIELLGAMRLIRILSVLHFMNSLTFAVFCVVLVLGWQATAISIIVAYAASCLLGTIGVLWRIGPSWKELHVEGEVPTQAEFWSKVSPYILWISLTSFTGNLFTIADRYMIIHHSQRFTEDEALATVGVYFSSRIIPTLIVTFSLMIGNVVLPHLSRDWEQGKRDRVRMRLNLFIKLLAPFLTVGGLAVLAASPLIFGWALGGKYDAGLPILPMTLAYCIWMGLFHISEGYLLCAEKAKLCTVALFLGLVVNIALNLILLPKYGLEGAVTATTIANALVLIIIVGINRIFGFRLDHFTLLMLVMPVLLFTLHYAIGLAILAGVTLVAWLTGNLFSEEERGVLAHVIERFVSRFRRS